MYSLELEIRLYLKIFNCICKRILVYMYDINNDQKSMDSDSYANVSFDILYVEMNIQSK